jgi:hypothetical protein
MCYTNAGQAHVYYGSASGLSVAPAFTVTGEAPDDFVGYVVGPLGDINGDGYSDIAIGADDRAFIYYGGASGLSATSALTITGFGSAEFSIGTAGDINGDGYADVIMGFSASRGYGRATIYFGAANGLGAVPILTLTSDMTGTIFAASTGTAGDVNGDGYADVIVGEPAYNNWDGRASLYPGNGGYGVSVTPQQRRSDDGASIAQLGRSDGYNSFRLAALGRSPFGRGRVKLEWEVKPLGVPFNGLGTQRSAVWLDSGTAGVALSELVTGLSGDTLYHWRVRLLYHPASTPFAQHSRWFTPPWNGWQEADLRTAEYPLKVYLPLIQG